MLLLLHNEDSKPDKIIERLTPKLKAMQLTANNANTNATKLRNKQCQKHQTTDTQCDQGITPRHRQRQTAHYNNAFRLQ